MSQQKNRQQRWVLVAAVALGAGLLGVAIAGCDYDIDSNSRLTTTSETSTPENPSGLQLTNSFGYIPTHGPALETAPIEPQGGAIDGDPFELGGGTLLPEHDVLLPTGATLTTPTG
ncbi:hypothetical protein ABI214_14255 [Prescottella soli]|uniref:Uncharacterized protein n=1 Tax=Prescottella soli TaxID=1543852 RepID=A0ABW9FXV7_9NOCA